MFIRMYVLSFLRNILIFLFLTPMLNLYLMALVYRVPNYDKEQLLAYVVETGDLSALTTPVKEYFYFDALVDGQGNLLSISDAATLPEEKAGYMETVIRVDRGEGKGVGFNVLPEDRSFHHHPNGDYYFSSKRVFEPETGLDRYHVIYNIDTYSFGFNVRQMMRANLICMAGASVISLLFAFLEVRPTKYAWENQKRLIANTSHELRTPVTVIQSVLELNEAGSFREAEKNQAVLRTETELLAKLVNDLMFLSRTDAKQILVRREMYELYPLLLETYIAAESLATSKSIRFEAFCCDDIEAYVDEKLIRQLVQILLNNAVEYTPEGGCVGLSAKAVGARAEIAVRDSGVGIAKRDQKRIFGRFFRVDNSQTSNKGNTGLGLAIAKWIVKQHGGSIRVESAPGQGSCFVVSLPLKKRLRDGLCARGPKQRLDSRGRSKAVL